MYRCHPLDAGFVLELVPSAQHLAPPVEARVDAIWAAAKERRGDRLFNGRVLSLVGHTPQRVTAQTSEYRRFVAQLEEPSLAAALGVRPLAVTGVLVCRDGLVLGKRADTLTEHAGRWEPAPAGSLDRPDPHAQLRDELEEELGIAAHQLTVCRPVGLVEALGSRVVDIVFDLRTPLTADEVRAAHAARATPEYADIAVVPERELGAYVTEHRAELLPALPHMLCTAGLLP
jgi:8-oxo-dGTP pyrophosphatase MutT (NUDIX family)